MKRLRKSTAQNLTHSLSRPLLISSMLLSSMLLMLDCKDSNEGKQSRQISSRPNTPGECVAEQVEAIGSLKKDSGIERDIDEILKTFTTLEEKTKVFSFNKGFTILYDIENLGLGNQGVGVVDGPAGVISPNTLAVKQATIFPAPLLTAASWDRELVKKIGTAMAREVKHNGNKVLLAPGVNLYRLPNNGRNFEYFGEDPYLISQTAVSFIKSVQSQDVLATVKHYCCNNTEFDRNWTSSDMDNRTLHEIYLPAYRASVLEGGVWSLMAAYNHVKGVPSTENKVLLSDILRGVWGFRGFVMSDWGAIRSTNAFLVGLDLEMDQPNPVYFTKGSIESKIRLGNIRETYVDNVIRRIMRAILGSKIMYYNSLSRKLTLAKSTTADFNAHHEIALEAARSGIVLLKNKDKTLPLPTKNLGTNSILVIGNKGLIDKTPRLGTGSANVHPTNNPFIIDKGGSNINTIESQMKAVLTSLGGNMSALTFEKLNGGNGQITELTSDRDDLTAEQKNKIKNSNYVVIPLGYGTDGTGGFAAGGNEGERKERAYTLPTGQDNLMKRIVEVVEADTTPAKIIVTITAGGGVDMSAWHDKVDAIVHSFYLGQAIQALPEVLFGAVNPSGKLPFTIEEERKHSSTYNTYELNTASSSKAGTSIRNLINDAHTKSTDGTTADPGTNRQYPLKYGEGIFVGYRHFDRYLNKETKNQYLESDGRAKYYPDSSPIQNDDTNNPLYGKDLQPLYAFGHGLSYSTFTYSKLRIEKSPCQEALRVVLDVSNTDGPDGIEIVQVYVRDAEWDEKYPRPYKELKGYTKVRVEAGQTQSVSIDLPAAAFAYYRAIIDSKIGASGEWTIDPGDFEIMVGASSSDIRQSEKSLTLAINRDNISITIAEGEDIVLKNIDLN